MTLDPKAQAALALHRFGFGPRAGTIAAIASDPRGALLAELERPSAGRLTDPDLLTTGEAARAVFDVRQERKAARLVERAEREAQAPRPRRRLPDPPRRRPAWRRTQSPRQRLRRRPLRSRPSNSKSIWKRRRRASMLRSPPSSVSPSGWSGSGRTISASPPTRCARSPAPTSARRSARMCSAALPTCCSPSSRIRQCWSISTMRARSAPNRRPASTAAAASTRISRAKSWSCIRSACAASIPRPTSPTSRRSSPAGP